MTEIAEVLEQSDPIQEALNEAKQDVVNEILSLYPTRKRKSYAIGFAAYLSGDQPGFNLKALPIKLGLMIRRQVYDIVKESGLPITRDPKLR